MARGLSEGEWVTVTGADIHGERGRVVKRVMRRVGEQWVPCWEVELELRGPGFVIPESRLGAGYKTTLDRR